MKTILTETIVEMGKGTNPRTQNLLDKQSGTVLTEDGEGIVHTTVAVISKEYPDDIVYQTHRADEYKGPALNAFALMNFSHRVAFSEDKAKSGNYLVETGADLSYDEEKLLAPSVYADKLNLFLKKCGFNETCDQQVKKAVRTWSDMNYVLKSEKVMKKNPDSGKMEETEQDFLMLIEGKTATTQGLVEAQLLKLRPKFDTDLFADYTKDLYTEKEIVLWAKSSTSKNVSEKKQPGSDGSGQ